MGWVHAISVIEGIAVAFPTRMGHRIEVLLMDIWSLWCASSVILEWRDAPSLLSDFVDTHPFLLDMDFSDISVSHESSTGSLWA
jgi:hypothetical protein